MYITSVELSSPYRARLTNPPTTINYGVCRMENLCRLVLQVYKVYKGSSRREGWKFSRLVQSDWIAGGLEMNEMK